MSVQITLHPEGAGGRKTPIPKGEYRGVFTVSEVGYSVRFFVPSVDVVNCSQPYIFDVQFLAPDLAIVHFPVGAVFKVWEGRDIGNGQVIKVLDSESLATVGRSNLDYQQMQGAGGK